MALKEFSAENVEAATVKAEGHFGMGRDDLHIKVVADETSGLFSIGTERRAVILARPKSGAAAQADAPPPLEGDPLYTPQRKAHAAASKGPAGPSTETSRKARELLEGVLERLPLGRKVDLADGETNEAVELEVRTDLQGFLIGRGGEVLAALTYLVNRMVNRGPKGAKRVVIEAEGYRSDRVASLERLALDLAQQVRASGEAATMEPMNSYDRRIVHLVLQKVSGITTESMGEGAHKRIVIRPVSKR
jgi:spoIIIJ-associated protein